MKSHSVLRVGQRIQFKWGTGLVLVALAIVSMTSRPASADTTPDWGEGVPVSLTGNANRYDLQGAALEQAIHQGKIDAQIYPVDVTGMLPPYRPFEKAVNGTTDNPLTRVARWLLGGVIGIRSVDQVFAWVGLHPYPQESDTGIYSVPYPDGQRPDYRMGFGTIQTHDGVGFTISCAACHSANLFGKTVLGLTNRFPRANETFLLAKRGTPLVQPWMLGSFADASEGEMRMFSEAKDHLRFIGVKKPQTLGLDTSLAQVALSLARRAQDDYATRDPEAAAHPRFERLASFVADSKPAVWWNLKYKDRWLSDGSVVSGNPIYTNLLWNEIGRGSDLRELETWLDSHPEVIRDLTSAVFSTQAPRFTDFFPAGKINLAAAKHGESLFNQYCARCHGHYDKVWDLPGASTVPLVKQLETWQVRYHEHTPVRDVGTDPGRWEGMVSLARDLNPLEISRHNGIVIRPQKGYVPPPLVGIWARWPYFHNNSAPSLCAVLTRHEDRPVQYVAVEANDPERDFDADCNGYPTRPSGDIMEVYDTTREGMHNTGHDEGIFLQNGRELLSPQDKRDLIQFLQTL